MTVWGLVTVEVSDRVAVGYSDSSMFPLATLTHFLHISVNYC